MKHNTLLTIASLLSLLFLTLHITDDIVRGISKAEPSNTALLVLTVFLYGTLVLAERRSGYIIILIASLLLVGIPVIHLRGVGVGFGTNRSNGLFFVWTLLAMGVTALFSVILSVRGLLSLRHRSTSTPRT